jgi:hypothetical protein
MRKIQLLEKYPVYVEELDKHDTEQVMAGWIEALRKQ